MKLKTNKIKHYNLLNPIKQYKYFVKRKPVQVFTCRWTDAYIYATTTIQTDFEVFNL